MRNCVALLAVVGMVGAVCLPLWSGCGRSADPAAAPELSRPPALVTPQELGGRQPLFDAEKTTGWQIEGPHRVQDGTLELGGAVAAKAVLERPIDEGGQVEFDFFQEGPAEAQLWFKPTLIRPHHDEHGRNGGTIHSMPARGGCRYQLAFQVAPGAKLYLRNVLVGGQIGSE